MSNTKKYMALLLAVFYIFTVAGTLVWSSCCTDMTAEAMEMDSDCCSLPDQEEDTQDAVDCCLSFALNVRIDQSQFWETAKGGTPFFSFAQPIPRLNPTWNTALITNRGNELFLYPPPQKKIDRAIYLLHQRFTFYG